MPEVSENKKRRRVIQAQKARDQSIDNGIRHTLADTDGRQFIWWLFEITDILGTSFRPGDTHLTAFALGEENVGKRLLARMEQIDPDAWGKLREEEVNYVRSISESDSGADSSSA